MPSVTLYKPKDYQKPIIKALEGEDYKYIVACLSRRIGKSLTAKNMLLKWCLTRRCTVGYVTPTGNLARKFIKEIVSNLSGSGIIKSSNSLDMFIETVNGSTIYFLSAESSNNNRGVGFEYIIYDEAAYILNETYQSVFKPMELQAKKVFIISTPNGANGFFYDAFNRGNSNKHQYRRYVSFLTNLEESKLYDEQTIDEIKSTTPNLIYEQEFLCHFITDGGLSVFRRSRVSEKNKKIGYTKLYGGIDFSGDGTDETVLTLVNENNETFLRVSYEVGNSKSIDSMGKILNKYNVHKCLAEKNSMGSISIDYLRKIFPRVEGITTTNTTKRDYVENVINKFENGIGCIENDPATISQFNGFVLKRTKTGLITYSNINDSVHDDRVISYCLACYANRSNRNLGVYYLS